MGYAYDMLGDLGQRWLRQPATPGIDLPPDPQVRERGAANLNLIDHGRAQIHQIGAGFAQQLGAAAMTGQPRQVKIYASPWSRTAETAAILAQHLAPFGATVHMVPELAPQSLGGLEGMPKEEAAPIKKQLVHMTPQNEPPGQSKFTRAFGESRDNYEARLLPALANILDESERNPNLVSIVAAHSGDMKVAQGRTRGEQDNISTARTDRMTLGPEGRWRYERGTGPSAIPGVYMQRHGDTEFNTPRPGMVAPRASRPVEPSNPSSFGNSSGTPSAVE